MTDTISEEEAIKRLRVLVERAGSQVKLAAVVGVDRSFIAQCLTRRSHITGKLAEHMGIRGCYAYSLQENKKDLRQIEYEEKLRQHKQLHGVPTEPIKWK